ncbi:2-amino-4-hydroxy-6-hydroxymethyldihydropteridine diphosphokinase [Polaromonas sp.]|uniref:2-amino-4-hydroxy-6- hydroxymethyldihydropteridine diphosphokinase n=1 Tax=Polaromonas sp. TaxID=1869339 RepID=UPI002487D1B2|nr:2-amino-4-hydroxy-6-hydroxymethyldihydropteridine diphosphokinase [Polaromonas sp.]MDI1274333.1 2-amino-4-hydroxy-6-hydroxymethyldihydropteridine diphosphokinase [Polaromonas sp.]
MATALHADSPRPVTAYVALGANLGDAGAAVRTAMEALAHLPLTEVTGRSSLYRTAPLADAGDPPGPAAGGDYINAVAEVQTALSAPELLAQLQALEQAAGRERPYRNAPRTLDLDLLLYGSGRIDSAQLVLPHPRMNQRAFVLVPLAQLAPALVPQALLDAVANQSIQRLDP